MIAGDGTQMGIMPLSDAMRIAEEQEVDLVEISPNANPPVCKLIDYGKYVYEQEKRAKEIKRNQKVVETKEIRLSPVIDDGDFNTKVKNAQKFLAEGNRLKVTVRFKGRQMAHPEIGRNVLIRFRENCAEYGASDKEPVLEGRAMSMLLQPRANKK